MEKNLFREENLKKAIDPEQLDTYLKVTSHKSWFVIAAAALVVAAIIIWAIAGHVRTIITGAGYCKDGKLTSFFSTDDIHSISIGDKVRVDSALCEVTDVDSALYLSHDIPNDVLYLLPESKWYSIVEISANLDDGLYPVQFSIEESPISFLIKEK